MIARPNIKATARWLILTLWLSSAAICPLAPVTLAQVDAGAIRVKSNEVLVPVIVLDKKRVTELQDMNSFIFWHEICDKQDFHALERTVVRGLSGGDFRVFEDGQEQRIESVTPENQNDSPDISGYRGRATEFVGIGGGLGLDTGGGSFAAQPPTHQAWLAI